MSVPGTSFNGPVISGDKRAANDAGPANTGFCGLSQRTSLVQNGAAAVSGRLSLPNGSRLDDFLIDNTVAWDSVTSATLSIGKTAGGTEYVSGVNVKAAAGRLAPTLTAAQLVAMQNIGDNTDVYVTVTVVGATTVGATAVTARYTQTLN